MSDAASENGAQYCADLVKQRDEDRWLAANYAPAAQRRRLFALYAFHIELKQTPSQVSEAPLGEIRLQWRRDALADIRASKPSRAHPVIEEAAAAGLADERFADLIDPAIDANARLLYGADFTDVDDLANWLAASESYVDVAAFRLLGGAGDDEDNVRRYGLGFALAREGRGLAPALADAVTARAREIVSEAGSWRVPADQAPALAHLALTRRYVRAERAFLIGKRIRLFKAVATGRL
ncbi:MAG: squalene/phytoene synthase family protein [Pseudomonadota bacterium]